MRREITGDSGLQSLNVLSTHPPLWGSCITNIPGAMDKSSSGSFSQGSPSTQFKYRVFTGFLSVQLLADHVKDMVIAELSFRPEPEVSSSVALDDNIVEEIQ